MYKHMKTPEIEVFDDGIRVTFVDNIDFLGEGITSYNFFDTKVNNRKSYDIFDMSGGYILKALSLRFELDSITFSKAHDFVIKNNLFQMNDFHKTLFYIKYISLKGFDYKENTILQNIYDAWKHEEKELDYRSEILTFEHLQDTLDFANAYPDSEFALLGYEGLFYVYSYLITHIGKNDLVKMLNLLPAIEVIYQLYMEGNNKEQIIKILEQTKGLPANWSKKLYF